MKTRSLLLNFLTRFCCRKTAPLPPLVICCGMMRSASTLQFQVVADLVSRYFGGMRLSWCDPQDLDARLAEITEEQVPIVLKTHVVTPRLWEALDDGGAVGFFVWRDLADVVPSAMRKFGRTFSETMASVRKSTIHWERLRRHTRVLTSRYEVLMGDIAGEAARYLRHLGMTETPESGVFLRELAERYSLSRQRKRVALLEKASFDPWHLLHPGHIQSPAGWGREMSGLTREQYREIEAIDCSALEG